MKPVITGVVLLALFFSNISYAQNDTPMEVLVNIAHEDTRFIPFSVFKADDRNIDYLSDHIINPIALELDHNVLATILRLQPEALSVQLPYQNGEILKVQMINHDIRSEGFEIIDLDNKIEVEIPDAAFYRGTLEEENDALAGMSFFENEIYAIFSTPRRGNMVLVQDPINPGDGEHYLLYAEEDLVAERKADCQSDIFQKVDEFTENIVRSNVYSTCNDVEVYVEATYQLYQQKGGTVATSNFISAFFNNTAIIYRNEGIYTSLKKIAINTSEDGYSSLNSSIKNLNRFGERTKNKYQQHGAELAHLVDYNEESLGGVAWIDGMCNNHYTYVDNGVTYHPGAYAYSSVLTSQANFPDYSLTVFMFAHEMGHNLGSKHTQSCTWSGGPIDNCAPVEDGNCSSGPTPSKGGTIMSYCHKQSSIGINFSEGFSDQPGDLIRSNVASKTCVEEYAVKATVKAQPSQSVTANRECTNESGWTNYFFDNNTSDEADDQLILSVKKEGEDIGNLDDGTLIVQMKTSSNAGNGSTHISSPGYDAGSDWHVMNRWFELIPTREPLQPVTVRFPYTTDDLIDVMINQPGVSAHHDLIFYKIGSPENPNPDQGHESVTNEDITFYVNGDDASLNHWKYVKSGSYHLAEFKVSSFSGGGGGFTENAGSALPVRLMSYQVSSLDKFSQLEWNTDQEVNNDFFTIERSEDGISYEKIGKVNGAGTSLAPKRYEFLDRNPKPGINFYRLSQTDYDGTHVYLGVRTIVWENQREIEVFPNPLQDEYFTLNYSTPTKERAELFIRNIEGKVVFRKSLEIAKGENQIEVPADFLASGIYLVQIVNKEQNRTIKLIKD